MPCPGRSRRSQKLDVFTLLAIMAPLGIGFVFSWSHLGRVCGQFDLADIGPESRSPTVPLASTVRRSRP